MPLFSSSKDKKGKRKKKGKSGYGGLGKTPWQMVRDPASNSMYFHNVLTRKNLWECPKECRKEYKNLMQDNARLAKHAQVMRSDGVSFFLDEAIVKKVEVMCLCGFYSFAVSAIYKEVFQKHRNANDPYVANMCTTVRKDKENPDHSYTMAALGKVLAKRSGKGRPPSLREMIVPLSSAGSPSTQVACRKPGTDSASDQNRARHGSVAITSGRSERTKTHPPEVQPGRSFAFPSHRKRISTNVSRSPKELEVVTMSHNHIMNPNASPPRSSVSLEPPRMSKSRSSPGNHRQSNTRMSRQKSKTEENIRSNLMMARPSHQHSG
eukprot:519797_1